MKKFQFSTTFITVSLLLLMGCKEQTNDTSDLNSSPIEIKVEESNSEVIDVLTTAMEFQMPDTLRSGWNTFRYKNASPEVHFMIFERMPEGITIKEYKEDLIPPFKEAMNFALAGEMDKVQTALSKFPAWWADVTVGGGTGFISPDHTAKTTFKIDPGLYIVECYVRMADGTPHALMGMLKQVIVKEETSNMEEPDDAIARVQVSTENGITLLDSIVPRKTKIQVEFVDQKTYENLLGHDLNLVKVESSGSLDSLSAWLNTTDPRAMTTPSPEGITFLGGVNDLQAGDIGYFDVEMKPGNYAFISEVPQAIERKMYLKFRIQ